MNKIIGLSIFLIAFIAILTLSGDAPYYHLFPGVRFMPWQHTMFEVINSLVLLLIFFKAQNIYSKTQDKRMMIVGVGFLVAGILCAFHSSTSYSFPYDVLSVQNLYNKPYLFFLIVQKMMISASLFLFAMSTANSSNKIKVSSTKNIYIISFFILLTSVGIYHLMWSITKQYDLSRLLLLGQIIIPAYVSLFFITAFIYAETRIANKKNIFSTFMVGLVILGIDHLFFINPHLVQVYGIFGHALKITGFIFVLIGLNQEIPEVISFKQKLLAYLYIILLLSYLVIASSISLLFNMSLPQYFPQVFIEFLLIAGLTIYIITTKLIQPVLNISNHIEKHQLGKEPEKIPVISNDEIGVLTKKLNEIMNLKWEHINELKYSREIEALLRKIVETIGQSLDLELILNIICKEVSEVFKPDKVSIASYPNYDDFLQWELTSQWKSGTDIHGADDIEYSPKSKRFLGMRVVNEGKDIIADDIENSDLPDHFIDTQKKMNIKSYIAVPIEKWGVIGLSQVHNYRHWTEEEIQLLHTIASQAYIAIRQADLYATAKKLNEELEQKVIERTKQLEAVNKELESFAYTVSHDLRAPLRGMDGYSLALLEDYGDKLDDTGKEYLQIVRTSSQKMGQLINDILNLSRLNRSEMNVKSINLSLMANDIINELKKQNNTRNVECKIAENLQCEGDEAIIRVALQNLIENAWKFTMNTPNPVIEFGITTSEDNKEVFFVKDNGAGFDMRHAAKLFMPFQRLHQTHEYPGTGIGLATVHGIIKRHNGEIWAESEIGKGSTFFFVCRVLKGVKV